MREYYEELILKSFDSVLNREEEEELRAALENDGELQKIYSEYFAIRKSLSKNSVREFSNPFFEERIIEKLNSSNQESLFESLLTDYKKVLVPSLILTIILIVLNLSTFGNLINTDIYTSDVNLVESYTTTIYMDLQNE